MRQEKVFYAHVEAVLLVPPWPSQHDLTGAAGNFTNFNNFSALKK